MPKLLVYNEFEQLGSNTVGNAAYREVNAGISATE